MTTLKTKTKKGTNVNPKLTNDTHNKLVKLAISCGMTKTMLAKELIEMAVNHTDIINFFQDKYNKEPMYRIRPINNNGKVNY